MTRTITSFLIDLQDLSSRLYQPPLLVVPTEDILIHIGYW